MDVLKALLGHGASYVIIQYDHCFLLLLLFFFFFFGGGDHCFQLNSIICVSTDHFLCLISLDEISFCHQSLLTLIGSHLLTSFFQGPAPLYQCSNCLKSFKSEHGCKMHMNHCKAAEVRAAVESISTHR